MRADGPLAPTDVVIVMSMASVPQGITTPYLDRRHVSKVECDTAESCRPADPAG
jgi:hypothetical protein